MAFGFNQLPTYSLLDPFPDDAGHLVTVELDDGVGNLDLLEGGEVSLCESLSKHPC